MRYGTAVARDLQVVPTGISVTAAKNGNQPIQCSAVGDLPDDDGSASAPAITLDIGAVSAAGWAE